ALWLLSHRPKGELGRIALAFLALTGFALALTPFFKPDLLQPARQDAIEQVTLSHEAYNEMRLNELLAADDPVFVYMTAAWCITCKVNEKIAIDTAATEKRFAENSVTVMKGD